MPHAGEHHREAVLVGRGDHLVVAHAAAGLDDRRRAGLRDDVDAVAEREERIGRDHRAGEREARVLRLDRRDARGVDAAHLPGADAERPAVAAEHDRVRLHELRDAPGEQQVVELGGRRRALRSPPCSSRGGRRSARRASARAGRRRRA